MIYLIVIAVVEFLLIAVMGRIMYKSFITISELNDKLTYSDKKLKENLMQLLNYLEKKKSKLSMQSKIDILNLWYDILLSLPDDYAESVQVYSDNLDYTDTSTNAQHKKIIMDACKELIDADGLLLDSLTCISYHMLYIIFK